MLCLRRLQTWPVVVQGPVRKAVLEEWNQALAVQVSNSPHEKSSASRGAQAFCVQMRDFRDVWQEHYNETEKKTLQKTRGKSEDKLK